jgi:hypothetical protein
MKTAALKTRLDRLEAGLQTLIEGRLARLLPGNPLPHDLSRRMLDALLAGARPDSQGVLYVPDRLTIATSLALAESLIAHPALTAEWQANLQQAAQEAGLHFRAPLRLTIEADEHLSGGQVRIRPMDIQE